MKILLVNPYRVVVPKMGRPTMITELVGNYQPLGLLYIAGYALKHNPYVEIKIVDGLITGKEKLIEEVKNFHPDLVGMTAYTLTILDVKEAISLVKNLVPSALICLGGHHIDCYPEETLQYDGVDFVVRGEGEIPFSELLDALKYKKSFNTIKGLGYRDENGKIFINEVGTKIENMDLIPFPPRHLINVKDYYCVVGKKKYSTTILSARGCPYRCIFCKEAKSKNRARSIGNILDEMEECIKMGIEDFFFYDDTFNITEKKIFDFCAGIRKRGIKCSWSFRGRVNGVSYESLKEAKECGCFRIQFGVEAGTEKALKNLQKDIKLDDVRKVFKWTNKLKIPTVAYFILGNPGETIEDINKTVDLAIELNPTYANFSILVSMPATQMNIMAKERGFEDR